MENRSETSTLGKRCGTSEIEGDSIVVRFGRRLAALLTQHCMDGQQSAIDLELSVVRLHEIESGIASPSLVELCALAQFLGITISQLLHNL
jgi:transcriptional regulator with XRE-family HTH domain